MNARQALTGLRLALGVTAYLRPALAARVFGIDPAESPALPGAVRLFGAREAAMGVALLGPPSAAMDRWLALGVVVDGLDVLTVALGARRRQFGAHTILVGGGLAAAAVVLGLRARQGFQA